MHIIKTRTERGRPGTEAKIMLYNNITVCTGHDHLLGQTSVQWSEGVSEDQVDGEVQRMINNMNSGKLKGTLLINEEDRNVKMNF